MHAFDIQYSADQILFVVQPVRVIVISHIKRFQPVQDILPGRRQGIEKIQIPVGRKDLPDIIADTVKDDIECIELVGLCTDVCVISNAIILKAFFRS